MHVIVGMWRKSTRMADMSRQKPQALFVSIVAPLAARNGRTLRYPKMWKRSLLAMVGRGVSEGLVPYGGLIEAIYGDEPDGGPLYAAGRLKNDISNLRTALAYLGIAVDCEWGFGLRMRDVEARHGTGDSCDGHVGDLFDGWVPPPGHDQRPVRL